MISISENCMAAVLAEEAFPERLAIQAETRK